MKLPSKNKIYTTTAVWNETHYRHFGIIKELAFLYGDKPEDIVELKFKIADDQNIINSPVEDSKYPDYWAFYDIKQDCFTLIYPARFLLDLCFPCAIKAEEDRNLGKAYRIEILK